MNNRQIFINISVFMLPTSMYYISLERPFYSVSGHFLLHKIDAEMVETLQVNA